MCKRVRDVYNGRVKYIDQYVMSTINRNNGMYISQPNDIYF